MEASALVCQGSKNRSRAFPRLALYLVLTVSKGPTTSASVSASGSASGGARAAASASRRSADRGASASTGVGGCESEGSRGNPRGVEAHGLARPTVRTCALLPGPSIGLSVWGRGAPAQPRSTLSDQPQTGAGRFVPGHCARVRPWPLSLPVYQHCQHQSVFLALSSSITPASQLIASHCIALHRTALHCIASHCIASYFIAPHHSTARLCPAPHLASRTVEPSHRRRHPSICSSPRQSINQTSLIATASSPRLQSLPSRSRHSRACYLRTHLTNCAFRNSHHAVPAEAQG